MPAPFLTLFTALLTLLNLLAIASCQTPTSTASAAPSSTSIVPNVVDGTANESAAIIPIDYALARQIVPSNYSIMREVYESVMGPGWPRGKYPAVFSLAYETNDTSNGQLVVSNLTRVAIRFPFIDRLPGSGIPFRFANVVIIQAPISNIVGSSYLQQTFPGTFEPRLGGYTTINGSHGHKKISTAWNSTDEAAGKPPAWQILLREGLGVKAQWPIEVFQNLTNQPLFGHGSVPELCLIYKFDQSVFADPPAFDLDVSVSPPYWPSKASFRNVSGIHIPAPFEETFLSCSDVPGALGNGSSGGTRR